MSELAKAFFIKHKPVAVDFHVPEQKQVAKGQKQCKIQKSKCKTMEIKEPYRKAQPFFYLALKINRKKKLIRKARTRFTYMICEG